MSEFKLSYTAEEIDEKLGLISESRSVPENLAIHRGKVLGDDPNGLGWNAIALDWKNLSNRPFGVTKDVLQEQQLYYKDAYETGKLRTCFVDDDDSLIVGESYVVTWEDTEYTCIAKRIQDYIPESWNVESSAIFLGNVSLFNNGETFIDTGEPFLFSQHPFNGGIRNEFATKENVTYVRCAIKPVTTFRKIPKEYLPDDLGSSNMVTEKTITYDFATQGVPSISVPNELLEVTMYKVSNETPSVEELQGARFVSRYDPSSNFPGVNVTVDTSTALISTTDVFMSNQYSDGAGNYNFAVCYKAGEISFTFMDMPLTITVPEAGVYIPFSFGVTPPANWQFSLTYQTSIPGISWNNLEDKPFGEVAAGAVAVEETTVTIVDIFGMPAAQGFTVNESNFVVGATYNITVNGTEYTGECIYDADDFEAKIIQWSDGMLSPYVPLLGTSAYLPNSATVGDSVSIKVVLATNAIATIDPAYMPDGFSLPEVSTSNNGQVMTVVNGVWGLSPGLPEADSYDNGNVLRVVGGVWRQTQDRVPVANENQEGYILTTVGNSWVAMPPVSGLPEVSAADNGKVLSVVEGEWVAQTPASGLPDVTADDVGKFLRVSSDGAWVVESVPNAEEVTF